MQGIVLSATYDFTDAISGTVRVADANRIDHSVGTDGLQMGTPGTAPGSQPEHHRPLSAAPA